MSQKTRIILTVLGGIACAAPATLLAQDKNEDTINIETPRLVEQLFDCREIADSSERLACYDREVNNVYEAQTTRELVIADREQIKETKRGLFGFKLPKIGLFDGGDDDEEELNELTTTLTSARQNSSGRYILVVEGGARWMQTDKTPVFGKLEPGDEIVIKSGVLGSYMAKIGKRRAVRVRRLD